MTGAAPCSTSCGMRHVIRELGDGWALLHIDRHLLHDLSGPPALAEVAARGLTVHDPELVFATPDHAVSSQPGRNGTTYVPGGKLWTRAARPHARGRRAPVRPRPAGAGHRPRDGPRARHRAARASP